MRVSEVGGERAPGTRGAPAEGAPRAGHASHAAADHGHGVDDRPVFVGPPRQELEEILTRYPTKMAALLPALWIVQRERGWVSVDAMAEVAEVLGLTPAYVKGVVTFYTMYHQHPVGQYFVQVCTTSPCGACGADETVAAFVEQTGCRELGVTSPDGKYTVIEVECLGACGFPTPVLINEEFIESVTADKVSGILSELR